MNTGSFYPYLTENTVFFNHRCCTGKQRLFIVKIIIQYKHIHGRGTPGDPNRTHSALRVNTTQGNSMKIITGLNTHPNGFLGT
jgi:hypothetical protein